MALISKSEDHRLTAILLMVVVLIVAYLLCFHWFILKHAQYNEEISELSSQLGRYQRVAAQKTDLESLLRDLQNRRSDFDLFLSGNDFNEAAAGLSERLNQMVRTQADADCQIVSRQPVRPRVKERFQKVTVNVRMRCGVEDLKKIVYALETSVPMVLTEELTVIKPRSRRRRGSGQETQPQTLLDIRFNMSGYLRESS